MAQEYVAAGAKFARDAFERVAATFGVAFGAELVASGWFSVDELTDMSIVKKAGVAGLAAVLTLAKAFVAKKVGREDSASLDPAV